MFYALFNTKVRRIVFMRYFESFNFFNYYGNSSDTR